MQLGQKEPIHWCRKNVGDGNPMQLKRKGISPTGNVSEISMATGKTITKVLGNAYMQLKEYEKPMRGWVWYHECPSCEDVPQAETLMNAGQTFADLDLCDDCMKRENLIAVRQAAKKASTEDYIAQFHTANDKLTEVLAKIVEKEGLGSTPQLTDEQLAAHMPKPKATRKTRLRSQKEVDETNGKG